MSRAIAIDKAILSFIVLFSLVALPSIANARVFAFCYASGNEKIIRTDIFQYDEKCSGGGLNWSCHSDFYTSFVQETDPEKLMGYRGCSIANTIAELEDEFSSISASDKLVIRSTWKPSRSPSSSRSPGSIAKDSPNRAAAAPVKYGFCFITILQSSGLPQDRGKLDNAYFSDVFQVARAKVSVGGTAPAFVNGLQTRMIRQIAEEYGDSDPRMERSCQFFDTAAEAERIRLRDQGVQRRSRGGGRIIETHFLLGQPAA